MYDARAERHASTGKGGLGAPSNLDNADVPADVFRCRAVFPRHRRGRVGGIGSSRTAAAVGVIGKLVAARPVGVAAKGLPAASVDDTANAIAWAAFHRNQHLVVAAYSCAVTAEGARLEAASAFWSDSRHTLGRRKRR